MRPKLRTTLGLLAAMAIMAMATLHGPLRGAVLLLLGGLGFKVWIAELKRRQEAAEERERARAGGTNVGDGRNDQGDA